MAVVAPPGPWPDLEVGCTEEDREVQALAHRFAAEVLRPTGIVLDRLTDPADVIAAGSPLWDVFDRFRATGLGDLMRPDPEADPVARARLVGIVNEELAWGDVGLAITLGLTNFHQPWVELTGDAELIERHCDPSHPGIGCWALTEPDHGSDTVASLESYLHDPGRRPNCVARRDGDGWILSGQKAAWVSNGSIATVVVLFCAVDEGDGINGGGVFVVPTDLPGVVRPSPLDKLGQRSLNQGEIVFDGVRLPGDHRVVGPDFYPLALEAMLAHANAAMGGLFVGVARAAFEMAVDYAKERCQGGRPIIEHQSVKARLFSMFSRVEAARSLARRVNLYNAAAEPIIQYSIASKTFVTRTAFEVASDALQIFGGNGLSREYPIEKILRDARASMIEDGCNEVLGLVAAERF
ncbi:MAG: acyl-CoA dehydrogenase family protein [Acidimicrobiia bacterium]